MNPKLLGKVTLERTGQELNIHYQAPGLASFYREHRQAFADLYPSEQAAFEYLAPSPTVSVLDLGCACGGLGWALFERFDCRNYTGIEIHAVAAREGNKSAQSFGGCVLAGDMLQAHKILGRHAKPHEYDVVISLSAVDWNVDVEANVRSAWSLVKVGGHLVVSLRLHPIRCINDVHESFQPTTPESTQADEIAPYVVISVAQAFAFVTSLGASTVTVFGNTGKPSVTAVTSVDELFFVVAVLEKGEPGQVPSIDVQSPNELRDLLEGESARLVQLE